MNKLLKILIIVFVLLFIISFIGGRRRYYCFRGIPITIADTTCILGKWQLFGSPKENYLTFPRFTGQFFIVFEDKTSFNIISSSGDSSMIVHDIKDYTCTKFVCSHATVPSNSAHYLIYYFVWDFGRFYPIVSYPLDNSMKVYDGYRLFGWKKYTIPNSN